MRKGQEFQWHSQDFPDRGTNPKAKFVTIIPIPFPGIINDFVPGLQP